MRAMFPVLAMLAASFAHAADAHSLTADELRQKVVEITEAQNKVMLQGSTAADVDRLFSLYTDDFTYLHEAYGGSYTRDELRANTLRLQQRDVYDRTTPRYVLVSTIPGHDSIAVEREETHKGIVARHLAVFEFRGSKVSRIIEYWM